MFKSTWFHLYYRLKAGGFNFSEPFFNSSWVEMMLSEKSYCSLERFHIHRLCRCRLRYRMQYYQMESFTRSPIRQKMPAPPPTFGNAAGYDSICRRSEWPPACRLQCSLMSPFTHRWRVAGDGHLFVILTVLTWFESVSLVSQSSEYLFSLGYFLLWECAHYLSATLIELVESRPCLWDKTADCFKDKIDNRRLGEKFMYFWKKSLTRIRKNNRTLFVTRSTKKSKVCMLMRK